MFGRRWHLQPYFFSSKISIIPFLTASVFVSLLSLQYCKSFKFVSASIRIFRLIDLGLSIFGLPVRGLIESPLFLCTTNYSIHYVHQKVNWHFQQNFSFSFVQIETKWKCSEYVYKADKSRHYKGTIFLKRHYIAQQSATDKKHKIA